MVSLIWTGPAVQDLDAIADYIALSDQEAAARLIQRVYRHVAQLIEHPESGSRPAELRRSCYRQIVERPCRVLYRYDGQRVVVLHVIRGEMRLRKSRLIERDRQLE